MTDENDTERCGAETQSGGTCKNPSRETCPHHGVPDDETPDVGRPSKLTEELVDELCEHLANGNSITASCRLVGITPHTYHEWKQLAASDEAGNSAYTHFSQRVAQARGRGEREMTQTTKDVAEEKGDSRTLLELTKAQYPDSFETDTEGDKRQSAAGWFERAEAAVKSDEDEYEELI